MQVWMVKLYCNNILFKSINSRKMFKIKTDQNNSNTQWYGNKNGGRDNHKSVGYTSGRLARVESLAHARK